MSASAIVMMVLTMGTITAFAGYFFYKVLVTPPKGGSDSFAGEKERPS